MTDATNPLQVLGDNIRQRREAMNLSQRKACAILKMQQATYSKIELGMRRPTNDQATAIARLFDYELNELHLMFPEKYPAPPPAEAKAA